MGLVIKVAKGCITPHKLQPVLHHTANEANQNIINIFNEFRVFFGSSCIGGPHEVQKLWGTEVTHQGFLY